MAETVAANNDLLTLILLCLPARSLFRFKSVSKQWFSLISKPYFTKRHFCNSRLNPSLLFLRKRNTTADKGYEFLSLSDPSQVPPPFTTQPHSHPNDFTVIQCCNGLLFCRSSRTPSKDYKHYNYHVYNPTTDHFSTIPTDKDIHDVYTPYYNWNFAFNPERSPHYKVLYISNSKSVPLQLRIAIYSSETRRWRVVGKTFIVDHANQPYYQGIYSNGAVHWMYGDPDKIYKYFNIAEERLGTMPMSPKSKNSGLLRRCFFREWKDHLHIVDVYNYKPNVMNFDVYELERDYSGWFLKYHVDASPVISSVVPYFDIELHMKLYPVWPVLIVRGERDEDSYMVLQVGDDVIVRYNLVDKTFRKFPLSVIGLKIHNRLLSFPYIESLHCA